MARANAFVMVLLLSSVQTKRRLDYFWIALFCFTVFSFREQVKPAFSLVSLFQLPPFPFMPQSTNSEPSRWSIAFVLVRPLQMTRRPRECKTNPPRNKPWHPSPKSIGFYTMHGACCTFHPFAIPLLVLLSCIFLQDISRTLVNLRFPFECKAGSSHMGTWLER